MPDPRPSPLPPHSPPPAPEKTRIAGFLLLFLALVVLLVLSALILAPFIGPIVLAMVLAVIGRPFYSLILRKIGEKWRGPAAGLSCATLIFLIFTPLVWIGWSIAHEAPAGIEMIQNGIKDTSEKLESYAWYTRLKDTRWFRSLSAGVEEIIKNFKAGVGEEKAGAPPAEGQAPPPPPAPATPVDRQETPRAPAPAAPDGGAKSFSMEKVMPMGGNLAGWVTRAGAYLVGNALEILLKFFLMVFTLYYFLKDGPQILEGLKKSIPLDPGAKDQLVETFRVVSRSIIRGSLGTALIQGTVAGIAFLIVGIPAAFWGALVAISSLVPPLGTSLIMVPLTVFLFLGGNSGMGIFLVVMTMVIGSMDNIVRPLLVGRTLSLHPIWLLLSVLGALGVFGPMGIIYGPLILVFLGTVLSLLVKEDRPGSRQSTVDSRQ